MQQLKKIEYYLCTLTSRPIDWPHSRPLGMDLEAGPTMGQAAVVVVAETMGRPYQSFFSLLPN